MSELLRAFVERKVASRVWQRDPSLFQSKSAPGVRAEAIADRFGWLDLPVSMASHVEPLTRFGEEIAADGWTDVYLLGMGGSSLCAEVLAAAPLARTRKTRLTVLDTTDEGVIRDVTAALSPATSLFIVASKSGSTIEVTSLERHFWSVMKNALQHGVGRHFVAITDPGTPLTTLADERMYRRTFLNPPDVGGRYSALSLFGLVPAAILGLDVAALVEAARRMATACERDEPANPGLVLGAFMAEQARRGRDKMTLLLPPDLDPLGVWIEQQVAESTGKHGRGVLPIIGEPLGPAGEYGPDRAFVTTDSGLTPEQTAVVAALEGAGAPILRLPLGEAALGAEFFRWEFATVVAGAGLGVNPFDEPNVEEAKVRTRAQLEVRRTIGTFRLDPPLEEGQGYSRREHRPPAAPGPSRPANRYVGILDYLPGALGRPSPLLGLRQAIRHRTRLATTYAPGPRYLHSTGQYHKGGPNTGLFLLFTGVDPVETPVPDTDYTFSTLKLAQAVGDFDALVAAGREVIHYHLDDPAVDVQTAIERILKALG